MFKELKLEPFKSRAAAARSLDTRCANVPKKAIVAWKRAWSVYQLDSYDQIPKLQCIGMGIKDETKKRKARIEEYKCLAVKHFLPVLKAKLQLLSGRARSEAFNLVCDLEHWRQTRCLPCYQLPNTAVQEKGNPNTRQVQRPSYTQLDNAEISCPSTRGENSSSESEFEFNENPTYEPLPGDVDFYIYEGETHRKLPHC